jgi:hypothetical protein
MSSTKLSSPRDGHGLDGRIALLCDTVESAAVIVDQLRQAGEISGRTVLLLTEASYALHRAIVALSEAEASASPRLGPPLAAIVTDERRGTEATGPDRGTHDPRRSASTAQRTATRT